jgi:hypothetical protein
VIEVEGKVVSMEKLNKLGIGGSGMGFSKCWVMYWVFGFLFGG